MALLRAQVFGKLRLQCGDAVVDLFPTRHVAELLGYLLLNQHTHHPREKLVDVLWPDSSQANSRASFSTTLWRLRGVFDRLGLPADAYIQATRDSVCFEPRQPMSLDVADFEQHLARAERATEVNCREHALRAATASYQGKLCEGIYAEWCLLERERLERAYLLALGQLMSICMQRQAYEEAVTLGQGILRRDPLREEVHRAVMHSYWRMGNRAGAVTQFQVCSRLLRQELQILPMPETISLYRQIIQDRMGQVEFLGEQRRSYANQLQTAFAEFQAAADTLNALLDAAEKAAPIASTFKCEAVPS